MTILRILDGSLSGVLGPLAWSAAAFTAAFAGAGLLAARRFRRRPSFRPASLPAVTVLKPIKGLDRDMERNLESFLVQDYPRCQVLFCLHGPDDPALPILERLLERHPSVDADIVISKNRIGYNPKVNNLANAYRYAKHDVLLISDSDVRVEADFLRKAVEPLGRPAVGIATCFYRSAGASDFPSALEALSVNAQFLPQALVASMLCGVEFAMGAAMVVRREAFEAAGGLPALSNHLADDFVLGKAIVGAGWDLEQAGVVVDSVPASAGFFEQVSHLVRWSRTIRVCHPAGYAGMIFVHGGPLLLLHALAGGGAPALAGFAALEAWRALALWVLHSRYLGRRWSLKELRWLPVADVLQFAAWAAGLASRTVLWRGERYSISAEGTLVPSRRKPAELTAAAA